MNGDYLEVQAHVEDLVKKRGEKPSIGIYYALVLANTNCKHGSAGEVTKLLQDMAEEGINPDSATLHAVLRVRDYSTDSSIKTKREQVLAVHPDFLLRTHIVDELRQRWFSLTNEGWHDMVAGQIRDRELEIALNTLELMQQEDIETQPWLYDMMIHALCSAEEFDEVLRLLDHRLSSGEIHVSAILWSHILDTASRSLHRPLTVFVYNARVDTSYLNPSSGVCLNILSTAARHGDVPLATSVLRKLSLRSGNPIQLHHYDTLLETYIAANDLYTALTLLATMTSAGHAPTEASTRPIFTYLRQSPHLAATALHHLYELRDQGRHIPIQTINVLLEAYVFHHNISSAIELYNSMHALSPEISPNTATFNILFRGCAHTAQKNTAMFLASEMVALKISPDALSYDRLILVCLNSDDNLEDAWRYFNEMNTAGWWPRGGTSVSLAKRACALADTRVWRLIHDGQDRAISKAKMEGLVKEYWKGEIEKAEREPHTLLSTGECFRES